MSEREGLRSRGSLEVIRLCFLLAAGVAACAGRSASPSSELDGGSAGGAAVTAAGGSAGGFGSGGSSPGVGGQGGTGTGGGPVRGTGGSPIAGVGGRITTGVGGGAAGGGGSGVGGAGGLQAGIGPEYKWNNPVVVRTAGPYQPCGVIGSGPVTGGAASPVAPEIATISPSGAVLFFSLETSQHTRAPFFAGGPVAGVEYSRDGESLVVAGDRGVQIVNLADRRVVFSRQPFGYSSRGAALSPDGTLVAALGWDQVPQGLPEVVSLRLLRVSDGQTVAQMASIQAVDGVAPQFAPDGSFVVVGPLILAVPSLSPLPPTPLQSNGNTALSPDGRWVAQGGNVWNLASGRLAKTENPAGAPFLDWAAFSPDGMTYAEMYLEFGGNTIHLFSTSDFSPVGTGVVAPQGVPNPRFFFSGDSKHVALLLSPQIPTEDAFPIFQVASVPELKPEAVVVEPVTFPDPTPAFSPDGSLLAIRLAATSEVLRVADLMPVAHVVDVSQHYVFLGNGMLALLNGWVYDAGTGQRVAPTPGYWLGVSPDGRILATYLGNSAATVRLSDLTPIATLALPPFDFLPVTFSRDSRYVARHAYDGTSGDRVLVFDVATGRLVTTVSGLDPVAISPAAADGSARMVTGVLNSANLRVWSIPQGAQLFEIDHAVTADFSPDGTLIAAAGDGIRIVRADTGVVRERLAAHSDPLAYRSGATAVTFSPTGELVSGGMEGTTRFWCSP